MKRKVAIYARVNFMPDTIKLQIIGKNVHNSYVVNYEKNKYIMIKYI